MGKIKITGKCCICGGKYEHYGNNPEPLVSSVVGSGRCCDECNNRLVIPFRVAEMRLRRMFLNQGNIIDTISEGVA